MMQIKICHSRNSSLSVIRLFTRSTRRLRFIHRIYAFLCSLTLFATLIIAFGCNDTQTNPLEIGTEMVEITPPIGYPRYGYPPVESTGIKDPLNAKALVFKQGNIQGALLVCDLLGIPRDLSRIVRERVSEQTGIPFQNISISATHTHTSPGITQDFKEYALRESSGNLTEEDKEGYFTYLINGMTEAIISASESTEEVEMISGIGDAPGISFNRRHLMTDGRVRTNPGRLNPKIVRPVGPADPDVNFVLFRPAGQTNFSTSLTVFASHYVRGGTEFSADYPFYLQKRLREIFGDQLFSVFGLGACGNINTVDFLGTSPVDDSIPRVIKFGNTLAEAVERALPEGKEGIPDLEIISRTVYLPMQGYTEDELQWSKEGTEPLYNERSFLQRRRRLKISIWGVQPPLEMLRKYDAVPPSVSGDPWHLPVEIHAFRLDSRTAIVTMPGELFVEFGIDLKRRSPFSNTMLIELANADIAYVPTEQAFREGDYEPVNSRLAPGSGEKMVDIAIDMLTELKKSEP